MMNISRTPKCAQALQKYNISHILSANFHKKANFEQLIRDFNETFTSPIHNKNRLQNRMQLQLILVLFVIAVPAMPAFAAGWGKAGRPSAGKSTKPAKVIKSGTYVIENQHTGMKYVGRSSNIKQRIEQHNQGSGSQWTAMSGDGWKLVKAYKGNNDATENAITRGVMRNEGIQNVRGGSYCKVYYPKHEFRAIKRANGLTNHGMQEQQPASALKPQFWGEE